MEDLTTFNSDDFDISPRLGPEYRASNRLAEAMLDKFSAEDLKPLIDRAADEFRDRLWGDVQDWLINDTEQNIARHIRYMVEQTVAALLTGREWAMQRYPYAEYSKGKEIREAVAKHGGDTLLARRVADLEEELARRDETINFLRRNY